MMYSISPQRKYGHASGEVRWEGEPSGPLEREESRKPWISRPSALFRDMRFLWRFRQQRGEGADAHRLRRGGRDWGSCSTRMMSSPKRRTELQGM